jgi:hypothetical protein
MRAEAGEPTRTHAILQRVPYIVSSVKMKIFNLFFSFLFFLSCIA